MTRLIGLTGPIGCGKSTVAGWLAERPGVVVIDADAVARQVVEPGQATLDAVLARFGSDLRRADGTLDRAALAVIVFDDPAALRDLETLTHPAVRRMITEEIETARSVGAAVVVVEAIKLVEGGLAELCDEVWLVTCQPAVQRARLAGRGADPADVERRLAAQGDLAARLRPAASRVIDTSKDMTASRDSVLAALAAVLAEG